MRGMTETDADFASTSKDYIHEVTEMEIGGATSFKTPQRVLTITDRSPWHWTASCSGGRCCRATDRRLNIACARSGRIG